MTCNESRIIGLHLETQVLWVFFMVFILAGNWMAEPLPLVLTIAPSSVGLLLLAFACGGGGGHTEEQKTEGEGTDNFPSPGRTENGYFSPY